MSGDSFATLDFAQKIEIQWKPLNVITLGQIETDNINRMITIAEFTVLYTVLNTTKYLGKTKAPGILIW